MKYETLSPSRKLFVDAAYKHFPDLNGRITREQILFVCETDSLNTPQWLTVPFNKLSRGVYSIPVPVGVEYTPPKQESDEEIFSRIENTYKSMSCLVESVASNTVNSLVISGSPGIGKSFTVENTLRKLKGDYYAVHKGYIRASHLFRMLWENKNPGDVVVLDDTDAIFGDETALNILKAALELKPVRRIGWGSEKVFEDQDGEEIPRYFDFQGAVIFLTNLDFHTMIASGSKYSPHLSAIESRSLVLDLGIKSKREYMIKIKQTLAEGMLRDKGITKDEEDEIMEFVEENVNNFRELSLRMIEKIAALYEANPGSWKNLVRAVCMVK
jgi:hypothetical protein